MSKFNGNLHYLLILIAETSSIYVVHMINGFSLREKPLIRCTTYLLAYLNVIWRWVFFVKIAIVIFTH